MRLRLADAKFMSMKRSEMRMKERFLNSLQQGAKAMIDGPDRQAYLEVPIESMGTFILWLKVTGQKSADDH